MDNVESLFGDDFKWSSYFTFEKNIGIKTRDNRLMVAPVEGDNGLISLSLGDETQVFSRAELAEFISAAGTLIDSESKWSPKFDKMIGLNY